MEKLTLIIAIITSIASLGVYGVLRALIKEIKEVVEVYKKAKEDGTITEKETQEIAKECMQAIEQGIKLTYLIKKAIKKK